MRPRQSRECIGAYYASGGCRRTAEAGRSALLSQEVIVTFKDELRRLDVKPCAPLWPTTLMCISGPWFGISGPLFALCATYKATARHRSPIRRMHSFDLMARLHDNDTSRITAEGNRVPRALQHDALQHGATCCEVATENKHVAQGCTGAVRALGCGCGNVADEMSS